SRGTRRPLALEFYSDDPVAHVAPFSLAVFPNQVGECSFIDNVGNRLTHPAPETEEMALAVEIAFLVTRLADAVDRRDRPVDVTHDLADGQLVGRAGQTIAPLGPASALHEPAPLELPQDDLQEPDRDHLPLGNLGDLEGLGTVMLRQGVDG